MNKAVIKTLFQGLAVSLLGILFSYLLWSNELIQDLEAKTWDFRSRLFAAPSPSTDDIVLILLDQQSIDKAHDQGITWPWPRELHGAVINNCRRRGALSIGVDALFTEPSRYGVDDDEKLGAALKDMPATAVASISAGDTSGRFLSWPSWTPKSVLSMPNLKPVAETPKFQRAMFPIPEVASNAAILCNVNQQHDKDGIYRGFHPFVFFDNTPLPTLGIGTYLAAHPLSEIFYTENSLIIAPHRIPLDKKGRMLLRFRGPSLNTYRALSAWPLILDEIRIHEGSMNEQELETDLKGKYVLYGFSAPGLMDMRPTPVSGKTPGVEIHATTLDNLLADDFLSPLNHKLQYLLFSLITFIASILIIRLKHPASLAVVVIIFSLLPVSAAAAMYRFGYQLYVVPFALSLLVAMGCGALINYHREGKRRKFIKHSFKHYLNPHVIEELIRNPDKLQLGGKRKDISIFFSDLKDFTAISEVLAPEDLTELLNEYLTAMTDIIHQELGTLDKYEGDAIIAFWNAPLPTPDHGLRCVRAALRCQQELARLRPQFKEAYGCELHMRIGINTGPAVVGNLGSSTRFNYTMLGDAVNLASRLEGANKQFQTSTMLSESTAELVRHDFPVRELARLTVVGRKKPVTVFEPFMKDTFELQQDTLNNFARGLAAFYQGEFHKAATIFNKTAETDPVAECYLKKCRQMLARDLNMDEWKGEWQLTSK